MRALLTIAMVLTFTAAVDAAEVTTQVSSREVYTGVPFTYTISINSLQSYESPELPAIEGLRVMGPPSPNRRTSTSIVNGRARSTSSVALTWTLVAQTEGKLVIPAVTVRADGQDFRTPPVTVVATAPTGGDRLFAAVTPSTPRAYEGQAVELTLQIWIAPYQDRLVEGALSSQTMWSLVDTRRSAWGDFAEVIAAKANTRRQRVRGELVERATPQGEQGSFYLFEFTTVIHPDRVGVLMPRPVLVMMQYPTRLQRSRSVFSRGELEIGASERLVAEAETSTIDVVAPPRTGRPPAYTGAIGKYAFHVRAKPTEVAVGDPITLTMTITDLGQGRPLELLAPPALDQVPALEESFRRTNDPLAGTVKGRQKVFTETIRATTEAADEIPAIPFAYFDPERDAYVTVRSKPIPISVEAARTIGVGDVIGADVEAADLTRVAGGLMASETSVDRLLDQPRERRGWTAAVAAAVPPLAFIGFAAGLSRVRRHRQTPHVGRRRQARRHARRRLAAVASGDRHVRADGIAAAVTHYIADRTARTGEALTASEVVAHLRACDVPDPLVDDVWSVLTACERARYAGVDGSDLDTMGEQAAQLIDRLERERLS